MKRKAAVCILTAAMLLTACGDNTPPEKPETGSETAADGNGVSEAEISENVIEEIIPEGKNDGGAGNNNDGDDDDDAGSSEDAAEEDIPKETPAAVKALLDNEAYWTEIVDSCIDDGGSGISSFWFQDINMDGTPEFIVGGCRYGIHEAFGYNVFDCSDGVKLMQEVNETNGSGSDMVMFWERGMSGVDYSDPTETGFLAQLYRREDGTFVYLAVSIDYVIGQNDYLLDEFVTTDGNITRLNRAALYEIYSGWDDETDYYAVQEYLYAPEYKEDTGDVSTISKEEFLRKYDSTFEGLTPYKIRIKDFPYAERHIDGEVIDRKNIYSELSAEEKEKQLSESYYAWKYKKASSVVQPLSGVVSRVRGDNSADTLIAEGGDVIDSDTGTDEEFDDFSGEILDVRSLYYYDDSYEAAEVKISDTNKFIDFGYNKAACTRDTGNMGRKAVELMKKTDIYREANAHSADYDQLFEEDERYSRSDYYDENKNIRPVAEAAFETDLDGDGSGEMFIIVNLPKYDENISYMRSYIIFADSEGQLYLIDETSNFNVDTDAILLDYGDFSQLMLFCPGIMGADHHCAIWGVSRGKPRMLDSISGDYQKTGCLLGSYGMMGMGGTMYFDIPTGEYRYILTKETDLSELRSKDKSGSLDEYLDEYYEIFGEEEQAPAAYTFDGKYYTIGHPMDLVAPVFRYENKKFVREDDKPALRRSTDAEYLQHDYVVDVDIDKILSKAKKP